MDTGEKWSTPFPIVAPYITWLAVWGHLHLALTHPNNTGPSRQLAYDFYHALTARLVTDGLVPLELAEEALASVTAAPGLAYDA